MTETRDKARAAYTHEELVAAISLARNHALDEAVKVAREYYAGKNAHVGQAIATSIESLKDKK